MLGGLACGVGVVEKNRRGDTSRSWVALSPCLEMAGVDVVIMHAPAAWWASARTSVVDFGAPRGGRGLTMHAAFTKE